MTKNINVPMWDQMQVFCKHIADHQIRCVLHFDRLLDESILRKALKTTLENNPIAYARYFEGVKRPQWQFSDLEIDTLYTVQKTKTPEKALKEGIAKSINTQEGFRLYLHLIRAETDILLLNVDHAISDASGVKLFMYQLAENYSLLLQQKPLTRHDYSPARSLKIVSQAMGWREKLAVLGLSITARKKAPTFKRELTLQELHNPVFVSHTLSANEFKRMKALGRCSQATVNDVLLALLYTTLQRLLPNSNTTNRITYSSDLRQYMDGFECDTLSNFSAIHAIDVDNVSGDFSTLLHAITAITKKRKAKPYNLADFPIMATLFKIFPYRKLKRLFAKEFDKIKAGSYPAAPGLSNTGIIDEQQVRFGSSEPEGAYIYGGINHPGVLQLVVSTYRNQLTLSIGSYNSFVFDFMNELKRVLNKELLVRNSAGVQD